MDEVFDLDETFEVDGESKRAGQLGSKAMKPDEVVAFLAQAMKPDVVLTKELHDETLESDGELHGEPCDDPTAEPFAKRRRMHGKQTLPTQVLQAVGTRRAELCGLSVPEYRRLRQMGWPICVFNLLMMASRISPHFAERTVHCVEFFSGIGSIARTFAQAGFVSKEYDIIREPLFEDLTTPMGFLTALMLAMQIVLGGLGHTANVCSSWVFMARGTTGRSRAQPYGTPNLPGCSASSVGQGNVQIGRMTVVIMLMVARRVHWVLEQPFSSVMDFAPVLVENVLVRLKYATKMGAFGAKTAKPTWLLSSSKWPAKLQKDLPPNFKATDDTVAIKLPPSAAGKKRVSGGPGLKATQAYPPFYSSAVLSAWSNRGDLENNQHEDDDISEISDRDFQEMDHSVGQFEDVCNHFGVPLNDWMV